MRLHETDRLNPRLSPELVRRTRALAALNGEGLSQLVSRALEAELDRTARRLLRRERVESTEGS